MNILLYSLNFSPELTGIGKYNGELVESLIDKGNKVTVVCAPPYYPEWSVKKGFSSVSYNKTTSERLSIYRCPLYIPKKVTILKRLFHLFSFAISSTFRIFSLLRKKFDVVIVVQPTLFCVPTALIYCKLTGAKSILHIQDYELDAMFGLGMAKKNAFSRLLFKVESFLMKKFDIVSTISLSMMNKAYLKGVSKSKLLYFPNWANTDFVNPYVDGSSFRKKIGIASSSKVILYAGNIGEKQGLELVLEAATSFKGEDVVFLFVGSGSYSNVLKSDAQKMNLANCVFLPLQEWEDVPSMLNMADIHLVIQKRGAADSVLPSKVTNILSCGGKAIVTAESNTELGLISEKYPGIYKLVEPENVNSFVNALRELLGSADGGFNPISRDYATSHLDKEKIIDSFITSVHKSFVPKKSNL